MRLAISLLFLILLSDTSNAAVAYVDLSLQADCETYMPDTRMCGSGTDTAYSSLDVGLSAVVPGDTLFLRAGQYDQIDFPKSGSIENPIVISGYDGETVTVGSSNSLGIRIIGKTDITIQNLVISGVIGFGRIEESQRIAIENVSFALASSSGTTGSLKLVRSRLNKIQNSRFSGGSDLLLLQDNSNQNVIERNTFGNAMHSLISIRCSSNNVIRENDLENPDQKSIEIYDCQGVSDAPIRLDDTKRNLLERNRFIGTAPSDRNHRYNAIQHGGQQTVVRLNLFHDNLGGGSNYQHYSDESLHVYGNRLYQNTFFNNRCHAIIGDETSSSTFYDNVVANNLLYQNFDCAGNAEQIDIRNPNRVILIANSIVDSDPGFVNSSARDLKLTPESNQIDIGTFVAHATSTRTGTNLDVDDASWFFDGFGIPGELGDMIQLEGDSAVANIVAIDLTSNTITLDRVLSWTNGQGVHLRYHGDGPDVGAFEFEEAAPLVKPNAPLDLRAN